MPIPDGILVSREKQEVVVVCYNSRLQGKARRSVRYLSLSFVISPYFRLPHAGVGVEVWKNVPIAPSKWKGSRILGR